jgi:hypothetical protein
MKNKFAASTKQRHICQLPKPKESINTKNSTIRFLVSNLPLITPQKRKERILEIRADLIHYRESIYSLIKFFIGFDKRKNMKRYFLSDAYQMDKTKDEQIFWTLLNIRERVATLKKELLTLKGNNHAKTK